MKREYQLILRYYPEYISKDVMYKICHISKRTALYLLESRLVPNINSGKKTCKYKIATKDVVEYLILREEEPERYLAPKGWYSGETKNEFTILPPEIREKMQQYYEQVLVPFPDVLSVPQAAEITGYAKTTVVRWCTSKKLYCFHIRGTFKIPKVSLIEFLLTTHFRGIRVKSDKHRMFIAEMRRLE